MNIMNETKDLEKINKKLTEEYYEITQDILENPEYQRRLEYHHHENRSVYTHCLIVSYYSYKVAKFLRLDYRSAAIAGLLHDFYYEDWQMNPKHGLKNMHGFVHAKQALNNSQIYFKEKMNDKINDSIVKHMFPLTFFPPKYIEGWIITIVDKIVSLEVLKQSKQLYKYVGLALIFKTFKIK